MQTMNRPMTPRDTRFATPRPVLSSSVAQAASLWHPRVSVAQAASLWHPRIRFPTPYPLLLVGMFRNPDPHSENLGNSGESRTPERKSSDANNNAKKRSSQRIPPLRSSFLCGFGSSQFPDGSGVLMLLLIVLATGGCRPPATKSGGDRMEPASSQDHELSFDEQIRGVRDGRLDVIVVENQTIRDQDLASLSGLKDLLVLTLDDTQITDAGLEHLRGLENLEHLRLRGAAITDTGLEHLLGLENLTILNLPQARFTDAGLARLKMLPNLEQLRFSSPHVTDAGMAELADFPVLWHLHLIQVPITDRGLLPFERATQLFSLYLDGVQVSDDGLRRLIAQRQQLSLDPLHLHIDQNHRDFDPLKGTHEH
jgi:hypothetical protein